MESTLMDNPTERPTDVFQAGSDSSPVSERPCTAVPVELLRSGRRCRHSAAPAFCQPSTACNTSLPARHLWLSGLFSCRPHSLELSPGFYSGPDHQCRLFQTFAQNVPVRSILVHSARLRFSTITALYKFTYLLTYQHCGVSEQPSEAATLKPWQRWEQWPTDHMTMLTMRITTSFSSEKNSHMIRERSPIVPIMIPNAMQKISTPVRHAASTHYHLPAWRQHSNDISASSFVIAPLALRMCSRLYINYAGKWITAQLFLLD